MLWLDTDPGLDDALALLLALGHGQPPMALSTVAGNQTLEKVTRNALRLLALAGGDLPVHAGANRPLDRDLVTAGHVHGESGLDGAVLPEPRAVPSGPPAWEALGEAIAASPPGFRLVAVGPLTNLALLLEREPEMLRKAGRIVVMGGSLGAGNVTAAAEFNFYVDPLAADRILGAGLPVTVVGLEVTHRVLATAEDVESLERGGEVSRAVAGMLRFYGHFGDDVRSAPVHDPCAMAEALWPGLVRTIPLGLGVDTSEGPGRGRVVYRPDRPAVAYGIDVDAETILSRLFAAVSALDHGR